MVKTSELNERIKNWLQNTHKAHLHRSPHIYVDREWMQHFAPLGLSEQDAYQWWLGAVRKKFADTGYNICWGERTNEILELEVWIGER